MTDTEEEGMSAQRNKQKQELKHEKPEHLREIRHPAKRGQQQEVELEQEVFLRA